MNKKALSPILSVLGALLLAIVVGVFSASPFGEREVAHAQTAPTLATMTLSGITDPTEPSLMSPAELDILPAGGITTSYTARVQAGLALTTVTATTEVTDAMVGRITATGNQAIDSGEMINLSVGTTTISIPVTLGSQTRTYTVRVTRAPSDASDDTKLSSLTLTGLTLSPTFDSTKKRYTDTVPHNKNLTTVRATASAGAEVDIKYVTDTAFDTTLLTADGDFVPGADAVFYGANREDLDTANVVALSAGAAATTVGTTTIAIRVRAADVISVDYYIVTVTRAAADANSSPKLAAAADAATTTGLALQTVADTAVTIDLHPGYSPDKTAYTAIVDYTVTKVTVHANPVPEALNAAPPVVGTGTVKVTSNKDDDVDMPEATDATRFVVDLAEGANVITIKSDAANAIATETYTVTVTRATATASTDANLSSLTLSRVPLSPAFDPGKTRYTAWVPNSVGLTTVRASTADAGAVVDINAFVTSISGTSVIDSRNVVTLSALATTTTTITITVTAANAVAMKEYRVEVTRAVDGASDDAKLVAAADNGLSVTTSSVSLSPPYDPDKMAYTASVPYAISTLAFTATAAEGARVMVTSDMDDDITDTTEEQDHIFTASVTLAEGVNVITIKVDAADAIETETYTVTVTRATATALADANLSSLTLSNVRLSRAFDPGKTAYTALVPNSVGLTTVRARPADSGAVVDIRSTNTDTPPAGFTSAEFDMAASVGSDNVVELTETAPGTTYILIKVTAENAVETNTYTVRVTRAVFNASDDASLTDLTLDPDPDTTDDNLYLNMPFFPSRTDYTTTAERSQSFVIVAPILVEDAASVMVSSNRDDEVKRLSEDETNDDFNNFNVGLEPGINVITIKVTAPNAVSMRTYTVTVTRPGEVVVSSDATLQSLALSGITLTPAFNPGTTAYTAEVEDVETTTVGATATNPSAAVQGTGEKTLRIGVNVINVRVLAEDGTTTQTYTVTVTVLDEDGMVTPGDDLLDRYDADDSGDIDKSEAIAAINDYLFGEGDQQITKAQAIEVINLYLFP